ncbi:E3 ubiquitin-protein ligase RNF182-like [Conger conger]|uniref:E3 ubiquitin-protein ligase RNF182-like n=1 Tax=Conger conger TaxID=82655 RepID=UPI002A59D886|nr:E3 ubiquitin-protein ligase RNF182-like [Conger conger]
MMKQALEDTLSNASTEELECKICYRLYNLGARRPKVLGCCHRLCAKCLSKMAGLVEVPQQSLACPFCRYPTYLTGEAVTVLPDDHNIVKALALRGRRKRDPKSAELLLSPSGLSSTVNASPSSSTSSPTSSSSSQGTSNCLGIAVVEAAPESPDDSTQAGARDSNLPGLQPWKLWRFIIRSWCCLAQALVCFLGILYFGSLPLGIFLLVKKKTSLGIFMVSLVPSSMLMLVLYDIFQWC